MSTTNQTARVLELIKRFNNGQKYVLKRYQMKICGLENLKKLLEEI